MAQDVDDVVEFEPHWSEGAEGLPHISFYRQLVSAS